MTAARQPVPIDPRIKERRIAVQREEGRRRLRLLAVVVAVLTVAAGAVATLQSPLFAVRRVEVSGASHSGRARVLRAGGLDGHRQLVGVDPARAARRIKTLPWVGDVSVSRSWPGTVVITVRERVPVAVSPVDAGKAWALVDGEGRVLEHVPERPPHYPALSRGPATGPPGSMLGGAARAALATAAALPEPLRDRVGDVVVLPAGEVELGLLPGGRVRVGDTSQLAAKIAALATVLARVDLGRVHVIDVRVPGAPVLTRG